MTLAQIRAIPVHATLQTLSQQFVEKFMMNSPSARPPRQHPRFFYSSAKSAHTLGLTSRHLEFPLALDLEQDPSCQHIYGDLPPLQMPLDCGSVYLHHFTVLALYHGTVKLFDCRTVAELKQANRTVPDLFVRGTNGNWSSPRLTAHLLAFSVEYVLVTPETINPTRARNLQLLEASFRCPAATFADDRVAAVCEFVRRHSTSTVAFLDQHFADRDLINYCLARRLLCFDMDEVSLTERADVRVYANEESLVAARRVFADSRRCATPLSEAQLAELKSAARISIDGAPYVVAAVSDGQFELHHLIDGTALLQPRTHLQRLCRECRVSALPELSDRQVTAEELVRTLSAADQTIISDRYRTIAAHVDFRLGRCARPARSLARNERRWFSAYFNAYRSGENPLLALAPRIALRGSSARLKSSELRDGFFAAVGELSAQPFAPNARAVWRHLCGALGGDRSARAPLSYETVRRWMSEYQQDPRHIACRLGRRRAFQLIRPVFSNTLLSFIPDTSHVEYVADSTLVDLQVRSARTGKVTVRRAHLTVLVDSFSGRIVGFYLYLGAPKAHHIMLALQESFSRFGCLPLRVLVDNGKEFDNEAVRKALSAQGVAIHYRVPDMFGIGHRVEGAFSRLRLMLQNLPGNTELVKDGMMHPGHNNPCDHATYDLVALRQLLQYRFYENLDTRPLATEALSPREICEAATLKHGGRVRGINVSASLLQTVSFETFPAHKLTYLEGGSGFRINGRSYSSAKLPRNINGRKFTVYEDPRDARRAYVYVAGRWHSLRCRVLEQRWRDLSQTEIWALTQELADALHQAKGAKEASETKFERFLTEMDSQYRRFSRRAAASLRALQTSAGSAEIQSGAAVESQPSNAPSPIAGLPIATPAEDEVAPVREETEVQLDLGMPGLDGAVGPKRSVSAKGTRLKAKPVLSGNYGQRTIPTIEADPLEGEGDAHSACDNSAP